jgi:DNA-binding NarL/FixJ family response regulator
MIADDHVLFVSGLQSLLADQDDITIIGHAEDGRELLHILGKETPDIVLLDINMPKLNGLDTARFIKQSYKDIKIIIISTYNQEHIIEKAQATGVNGYILKNSSKEELLQTIKMVMNGKTSFPYLAPVNNDNLDAQSDFIKQFSLTKREVEIINLIKKGVTNKEIATTLFLSQYTVETHRKHIMQKLNLKTPAALIKYMIEKNIGP